MSPAEALVLACTYQHPAWSKPCGRPPRDPIHYTVGWDYSGPMRHGYNASHWDRWTGEHPDLIPLPPLETLSSTPQAREVLRHVLLTRAEGGDGWGMNADLHPEEAVDAQLAALAAAGFAITRTDDHVPADTGEAVADRGLCVRETCGHGDVDHVPECRWCRGRNPCRAFVERSVFTVEQDIERNRVHADREGEAVALLREALERIETIAGTRRGISRSGWSQILVAIEDTARAALVRLPEEEGP